MTKPDPHPLDKLFKARLRSISMRQFKLLLENDLSCVPTPWRWPDPKTGRDWTLMGRKGELLWHASEAHFVKNHSVALHAIQEAIKHKEEWHESLPGVPDILGFWLGTMRYSSSHPRTQDLISRGLRGHEPGLGVPGDGGYLDQVLSIVENEISGAVSPGRKKVIHQAAASPWLRGCILRAINPTSSDWRPVGSSSLPLMWPLETVERVFSLAHQTNTSRRSVLITEKEGDDLVEQISRFPASFSFMQLLTKDALYGMHETLPIGTLKVIEHYHLQGLDIDPALEVRLSEFMDDELKRKVPALCSTVDRRYLEESSPTPAAGRSTLRL